MLIDVTNGGAEPRRADVAIVGAGPAGACAALLLARAGVAVTIFDGSHPREKPCGGGLTRRAVELVTKELGRFPVHGVSIARAVFETVQRAEGLGRAARGRVGVDLPANRRGDALLVVSRAAFDRALLDAAQQAGATLVAAKVTGLEITAAGATVQTAALNARADVIIGADGANSLVRRCVASPFARRQLSVGAGCYVHGLSSDAIDIRWTSAPAGYLWSFPRPDHLAVGACADATELAGAGALKAHVGEWLRDRGTAAVSDSSAPSDVRLEPYSWPIPALPRQDFGNLILAGERWLLAGDAAGLVDPLTREGIYWALYSAQLAAAAILTPGVSHASRYRADVQREIVPELARAAAVKSRFFTPAMSHAVVDALTRSRGVRRVMGDLIAGEQPYVGLKRRLAATGRIDLALSFLRDVSRR